MIRTALLACTLLAVLAACTPTVSDSSLGDGSLLTDIGPAADIGYRIVWQTNLGLGDGKKLLDVQPIGDVLVARESGNVFSVIDADTGRIMWRKGVGRPIERFSKPIILGDTLIIASETRAHFLRVDNGGLVNIMDLDRNAGTSPIYLAGELIFGGPSGRVFAHDIDTGHPRWEYQMGGPINTQPLDVGGFLLVADQAGGVAVLNPATGAVVWRGIRPPWGRITGQPAASETVAYVASEDQKLYAFERTSGIIYWQYLTENPLTVGPVVLDDRVFQRTDGRGLVALDALTGDELWRSDVPGSIMQQHDDQLVLRDGNQMHTIDIEGGKLISTAELPRAQMIVAARTDGGPLYLAHADGRIMKLAPR